MSGVDDLFADIVANPDDDGPRRVYADLLLEGDDPYGEFINVQLDLARDDLPREERIRRRKRERVLLSDHGRRWTAALDDVVVEPWFHRGFVEEATVSLTMLTHSSNALRAAVPLLRNVTTPILDIVHGLAWVDRIVESPILPQLEGLRLHLEGPVDPADEWRHQGETATFAERASNCSRLVALAVPVLRDEPLRRFIQSDLLRQLVWIDVSAQQHDHAWSILDAIPIGQLRGVRLDWRWIDRLLHESLRSLAINAGPRPALVRSIGNAVAFAGMHELDLGNTDWEAIQELAHARQLDSLRVLRLRGPIDQFQVAQLLEWPLVQRLEVLDLRGVTDAARHHDELARRFDGILLVGAPPRTRALGGCW